MLIFISCEKEEEEDTKEETKTVTVKEIDTFYIDYTTQMTYTITVLSANHVSMGKTSIVVKGAKVTALQGGTKITKETDETGMAVFNGLYKGAVSVGIEAEDYTSVNYLVGMNNIFKRDSATRNQSTQIYVSNIIPLFKVKNDPSVARLQGRVTYQSDLTNGLREPVPANTLIAAYIDASDPTFVTKYLKVPKQTNDSIFGGTILQIAYQAYFYDSTDVNGDYSITLPAAIDGLPIKLNAADLVAQQTVFENTGVAGFNRTKVYRTLFSPAQFPSPVPAAGGADVFFVTGSGALALASISGTGQVDRINVSSGGSGYTSVPKVTISGGGGAGALATAIIANGVVTGITINNGGSGYTSNPTVSINGGSGAAVNAVIGGGGSVAGIQVVNSGNGYLTVPAVTISAPSLPNGVVATAVAQIQNGNITAINVTSAGSGYTSAPTITIAAPVSGTVGSAVALFSGQSVLSTSIIGGGSGYTGNPSVVFSAPDLATGIRAQGIASIDPTSGQVIGFTITSGGSGYTSNPTVTLSSGSGAVATASFSGRILTGITITNGGSDYTFAPKVRITGGGGAGAAATATVSNGKVVALTITNNGSGYTSTPSVELLSGDGAQASVVVSGGQITAINLVNGGFDYAGAPQVLILPNPGGPGSGATATATVNLVTGAIIGITIVNPGTGYLGGNTPSIAEPFSITPSLITDKLNLKPGGNYLRDIHYGTGLRLPD